ncbi:MAG TPA: hypothetical protein VMX94_01015 [Armatimonadota bacterium]|nr:hypothetical protein [Armatimonadota bacterium]
MNDRHRLLTYGLTIALCLSASALSAAELQLAGIKLSGSALIVIQKYGNPSEVRVGAAAMAQAAGPAYTPGMPSPALGGMPYMTPEGSSMPYMPSTAASPAFGIPTLPGFPGAPSQPGAPTLQAGQIVSAPEVTWIYKFPRNKTLEFIISPDGRVVQIAAYGVDWPGISTAKGIRLGQTYKDVLLKYGFPESHERAGVELIAKYPETHRALFTFVGKTLVGITIALMD